MTHLPPLFLGAHPSSGPGKWEELAKIKRKVDTRSPASYYSGFTSLGPVAAEPRSREFPIASPTRRKAAGRVCAPDPARRPRARCTPGQKRPREELREESGEVNKPVHTRRLAGACVQCPSLFCFRPLKSGEGGGVGAIFVKRTVEI